MHEVEIVIDMLAVVAVLAAAAQHAALPYAPVLVLDGLLLGLFPGVPVVRLDPQLVLLGLIPLVCVVAVGTLVLPVSGSSGSSAPSGSRRARSVSEKRSGRGLGWSMPA